LSQGTGRTPQFWKDLGNYLKLLATLASGAVIPPVMNYFWRITPAGWDVWFNGFGCISGAFPVGLIFSAREPLWKWHTGVLPLERKLADLDRELRGLNPKRDIKRMQGIDTEYVNTLSKINELYLGGGGCRLPLMAMVFFTLATILFLLYFQFYLYWGQLVYLIAMYSLFFAAATASFALVAATILGPPKRYRRRPRTQ